MVNKKSCFIIAEAGVNHNGDLKLAKQLIDVAVEAGADAVKFQTFRADSLVTKMAPKADYQKKTTDGHESQYEMLKRLELSEKAHRDLFAYCKRKKILFLSTPFDEGCADFLGRLGVARYKIPSGELTNLPFLQHVAKKKKPMIISTGMATMKEVLTAVQSVQKAGNKDITLLHCVSQYPADPAEVNLRAMETMQKEFGVPVGFSDHTLGIEISLAAVALGAKVIEKHFTIDQNFPGPDHRASLMPEELRVLVRGIRNIEKALGDGIKRPSRSEREVADVARKSLVAKKEIKKGTLLQKEWIAIKRPGTGLAPSTLFKVVGKKAVKDIKEGALLSWEMFQ